MQQGLYRKLRNCLLFRPFTSFLVSLFLCHVQMKVIEHSAETLKAALVSKRRALGKLYKEYSAAERRFLEEGLRPGEPDALFQLITVHSDSDWISAHPEQPQSFESFYMDSHRRTPSERQNTIYIQTIGECRVLKNTKFCCIFVF